jgi:transcription-repair coupling factor (superfamily II helicase)
VDTDLLVSDCNIETDLEVLIPEEYVSSISERLQLYNELDNIPNEAKLQQFVDSLRDRFGPLPEPVEDLIKLVRFRWLAERLGFEKVMLKNGGLKGYFMTSDNADFYNSDIFGKVLRFVQQHPRSCRIKEIKNRVLLIVEETQSIEKAISVFNSILEINAVMIQ